MTSRPLRWRYRLMSGAALLALCAAPARAGADEERADAPGARGPSRFALKPPRYDGRLAIGTGLLLGLSAQERVHSDMASDHDSMSTIRNLSLAGHYRLRPTWVAGLRLARSSRPSLFSEDAGSVLWQFAAEARWQPEGELGPYAALSPGAAAAVDSYDGVSSWQWAPALGGALGFDVALVGPVALGFELRGLVAAFRNDGESFVSPDGTFVRNAYGVSSFVGLNLIASLGVGEREPALRE